MFIFISFSIEHSHNHTHTFVHFLRRWRTRDYWSRNRYSTYTQHTNSIQYNKHGKLHLTLTSYGPCMGRTPIQMIIPLHCHKWEKEMNVLHISHTSAMCVRINMNLCTIIVFSCVSSLYMLSLCMNEKLECVFCLPHFHAWLTFLIKDDDVKWDKKENQIP